MTALFVAEENGKYTKLTDISGSLETGGLITSCPARYYDTVTLGEPFTATLHCVMSRKALRTFAKIMMMPKYKETEWVFPKKKKRGTKRRRRNYDGLRIILPVHGKDNGDD